MFIDISKPPVPLPTVRSKVLHTGVTQLNPLSRHGSGPGLILVTPDSTDNLEIKEGVPSLMRKWAEEGYTVIEIQEQALSNVADVLAAAVAALSACETCEPKDVIGLIAYGTKQWNAVASHLSSSPAIVSAVVYAPSSERSSLSSSSIPTQCHFAGQLDGKTTRSTQLTEFEYANVKTASFAIPFVDSFQYATEGVSHTRNLTFLKRVMRCPIFDLDAIWEEHCYFEFENRSVEHTMATMVDEPYVNHVPTMTGGIGRSPLTMFYSNHFVFSNPEDTELELISRTVGIDRVIDEFIYKFTHTAEVDWLIPGIPPTNKRVEIPFTAVVNIRGDRLYHEHIAWDQGSVLRQLGLLPEYLDFPYALPDGSTPAPGKKFEYRVPVAGIETSKKIRDKNSVESNGMFEFKVREVSKSTVNGSM